MRIDGWPPIGHPGDGFWRAYLDGELSADQQRRLAHHLETCRRCRRRYEAIQAEAAWVAARLGALKAVAEVAPLPDSGNRVASLSPSSAAAAGAVKARTKGFPPPRARWRAGWVAAAAAALLVAVGLSMPSVRAVASQWITIFRAQEVRTFRISLDDFQQLIRNREALVTLFREVSSLVQVEESAEPVVERNLTLGDLRGRGFLAPGYLPDGFVLQEGTFVKTSDTWVRVDVDGVNRLLESLGRSERLPVDLEGQVLRLQAGRGYMLTYRRGDEQLQILQTDLPILAASGTVNLNQVLRAFEGLLGDQFGVSAALWRQLDSLDLGRTIPLPLLEGSGGTEVKVGNAVGTYHEADGRSAVMWVAGDRIHLVEGPLSQAELLRIAESFETP